MKKMKHWGILLIVLGVALMGIAGYAMEAWSQAVEISESMGISESLLEEAMRQPMAAQAMAAAMPSGGRFWYYAVIYRNLIMAVGVAAVVAGIVLCTKKEKVEKPWYQVERHETPANLVRTPVKPATPAQASVTAPVRQANNAPAPATPAATRTLTGRAGAMTGRSFTLGSKTVIGRSTSRCQIVYPMDTKGVSGIHCTVRFNGSSVTVTDENSSYGTYIDGVRLTPGHAVTMHRGQVLQLGSGKECLQLRS